MFSCLYSCNTIVYLQVSKGVMTYVTPEVKDLYHLLENEFLTMDLASKVQPLLTKISVPDVQLSQYVPALEKVATLRVLQQVNFRAFLLSFSKCKWFVYCFIYYTIISVSCIQCVSDHES